ncbi:MAG TPA: M1 family metallopeptidase [Pyrinomonadaceae bacterium]
MTKKLFLALTLVLMLYPASGLAQSKSHPSDKFRQLDEVLPTPNIYRTASGAPGSRYWQQRVDYVIDVEVDDANQRITGSETITYHNQSPDTLNYLWLQLDQNIYAKDAAGLRTRTAPDLQKLPFGTIDDYLLRQEFDGGYKITSVRDAKGATLPYTIRGTVMRVDLQRAPLASGGMVTFSVDWSYNINNARRISGRTGYEFFPKDGNYIYTIAQWFPRLAAYYDMTGWQIKEYLDTGEFALEFGDYRVSITVPDDMVVAATGVLQNAAQVLSRTQRDRLEQARAARQPVLIITPEEARANESSKPAGKKTWVFMAQNVRDFAFASSRKFIWDAQAVNIGGQSVMAMSFYPKEGNPLWGQYSTPAIIQTLNVYSRHTFPYPYPVAISVNGPVGGMEYPMISFNGPRPEADGTYSAERKFSLISVVIHEVGHNFFPMIINSDERQWMWLDEGFNSFLEYLAEQEWEQNYPSRRGEPKNLTAYMAGEDQVPVMTSSDALINVGNNAYGKTATALNILRETVLGRELFDYAFREYARRWKFKRPTPADFFRTMEDASGVDLDWFWHGWFYTTDHTDISIESVRLYTIDTRNPDTEKEAARREREAQPQTLSEQRNRNTPKLVDQNPSLKDFYNTYEEFRATEREREEFQKYLATLTDRERELLSSGLNLYVINLKNMGGLVMPVILQIDYTDGTSEELRIPAEIWRRNNFDASKLIVTKKEIKALTLDPHLETADTDVENNYFPRLPVKQKIQLYKEPPARNPMQELERKPIPESQQQQP